MLTLPIPQEVLELNRVTPKALINFLKSKNTVMLPDMRRIDETVERRKSDGNPVEVKRGFGMDCECWGTGWIHGQFLCGQHIPDPSMHYIVEF